jgi:hypothetical protein
MYPKEAWMAKQNQARTAKRANEGVANERHHQGKMSNARGHWNMNNHKTVKR